MLPVRLPKTSGRRVAQGRGGDRVLGDWLGQTINHRALVLFLLFSLVFFHPFQLPNLESFAFVENLSAQQSFPSLRKRVRYTDSCW